MEDLTKQPEGRGPDYMHIDNVMERIRQSSDYRVNHIIYRYDYLRAAMLPFGYHAASALQESINLERKAEDNPPEFLLIMDILEKFVSFNREYGKFLDALQPFVKEAQSNSPNPDSDTSDPTTCTGAS